jgi:hypothetical protein
VRFERGADSTSVDPAGNQVEHAGRSQVNVIRSGNSGIDRIAVVDDWEGEWFLEFRLLPATTTRWGDPVGAARSQVEPLVAAIVDAIYRAFSIATANTFVLGIGAAVVAAGAGVAGVPTTERTPTAS